MESEKKIFELMDEKHPMTKYWLPLTWATNIINRARREATITSDHMVQTILNEMSDIRWRLGSLIGYDNVNLPLVYTQVRCLGKCTRRYFTKSQTAKWVSSSEELLKLKIHTSRYFIIHISNLLKFFFQRGIPCVRTNPIS